jgi:hypothetical protein
MKNLNLLPVSEESKKRLETFARNFLHNSSDETFGGTSLFLVCIDI